MLAAKEKAKGMITSHDGAVHTQGAYDSNGGTVGTLTWNSLARPSVGADVVFTLGKGWTLQTSRSFHPTPILISSVKDDLNSTR